MSWREFTINLRMRGTVGKRRTVTRRFHVYANSRAEALKKAEQMALDSLIFQLETRRKP